MQFDVDVVVTYVDNQDPVWQDQIRQYNTEIDCKRYRQWDNLKYWFRGIEANMKFVRNVYMVVSNIEQVPEWVNQEKVKVVLHKDIIPEKYLPTFNSTTIEMFLCRIPGLAEHFIYFNDDMFVMKECSVSDFFDIETGWPKYQLIRRNDAHNSFRMQCRNSYRLACEAVGKDPGDGYFYIKHSADPMLKSDSLDIWERKCGKIEWSLTKFREPFNYTQYLFPDYSIMLGHWKECEYDFCYYKVNQIEDIEDEFNASLHKMICINDAKYKKDDYIDISEDDIKNVNDCDDREFDYMKWFILVVFQNKFSNRCFFEKEISE